ncbi:MAG: ATP-dependent zinc metalloprotease FtsH [Gemmatimonadota bacterium]
MPIRSLLIWGVVALVLVILFTVLQGGNNPRGATELSYSQLLDRVNAGQIASVSTQGETLLSTDKNNKTHMTYLPSGTMANVVQTLDAANVEVKTERPAQRPNLGDILLGILPMLLLIGAWFFFMRQMQSGGRGAMGFGRSKARLLTEAKGRVTFEDVAGIDEAKEELGEIVEFLKDPGKFQRLGGKIPKGALLVGPPGTGKTLLARAIAGEANVPFFSISGSDFVEMFVGVGASRVRDMFEQAKKNAPCIIFIDEIDAVGRHRGAGLGGGNDEREKTLNQLLVEMDGFEANEGIILIAATNRPDVLDPALLRPGRFDRQIVVPNPDLMGREKILRVHTKKIPLAGDVNLNLLAKATPGMSGADLANMVNEAALLAARRNKDRVYMEDLEEARDKVVLGTERKSMVISEEERRLTAYHEAGHALAALKTPDCDPLHKVTIVPRGRALGVTWSVPIDDRHTYSKSYLEAQLVSMYGGRVAEEIIFGRDKITTGAGNDIERATEVARRMVTQFGMSELVGPMTVGDHEEQVFLGREIMQRHQVSERTAQLVDSEVRKILDAAHQRSRSILEENLETLHGLAQALLERETLDAEEIQVVAQGRTLPPVERSRDAGAVGETDGSGEAEPRVTREPVTRRTRTS